MISEFELLADKVERLAQSVHALRLENAELRRDSALVVAENSELQRKISQAYERVAALLAQLPGDDDTSGDAA